MFDRGPFGCSHAAARPPARQSEEEEDATSREPYARRSSSLDGYLKHHHPGCSAPEGSDAQSLHLLHSQPIEQCDARRRQLHSQWSTISPPLSRMYLMNAPTVAAPRTEWRACGPPGGYSIPVCFNDSDAELSARGSSITNKVQMIIESLRSSQSSLDMSEKVVANVLQRQDGPPQACKTAAGPLATAKSKTKKRPAGVLLKDRDQSSDSDDSVDKGIEEAILEYLKEKDGHKREAELFVQSSRQTVPEIKSESQAFSIMRSRFPKSVIRATPATGPVKKYIKHKASLHEAALRNSELGRIMLRDQSTNTVKPSGLVRKIKGEDVRNDSSSSSDDGIEEAIQKYQLERIEQQTRGDLFKPLASVEESHSSSDDGIEEAIRSYQLEQLREKCAPKPQDKSGSSGLDDAKRHQPQKKKKRAQKAAKLVQPPSPTRLANSLDIDRRSQGDGLLSFRVESFVEQPTPAVPKANTTAELMCAEAILDISKTVMPGAFVSHLDVGPSARAPAGLAQRSATPERDSDGGGSVDSEDGIEQEIMKFLEQKAQMLKRSPGEPSAREASRGKTPRLSITKWRKHKDNTSSRTSSLDPSSEPLKAKSPPVASPRSRDKTEQSGDKSSSLDSDEDLDAAIKALLKTKKKSKKMTRSQRDSTKRPAVGAEQSRPCAKTARLCAAAELTVSKKARKRKSHSKDARGAAMKTALPNAPVEKRRANCGADAIRGLPPPIAQQVKEESSSVDSDDSIEQEIRKFLAEKAEKVSEGTMGDAEAPSNGTAAPVRRDLEREDQPAEIPRQSARPAAATPDGSAVAPQRSRSPGSSARSARTEQKPPTPAGADDGQSEKVPAVDQSVKWRQSFGLPVIDPKSFGRTQFHISSSKTSASPSAASSCQGKAGELERPAPASLWSSARHSWSAAKSARTPVTTPAFNPFSVAVSAGRHQGAASTVHVPRDKSVFVELESGRTNHVQVQSRQSDEGKARADQGAAAGDAGLQGAEEEFIDESEGESPEKKQSTL